MKKSHVAFGIALLFLGNWGIHVYDVNSACYDIVPVGKPLHSEILLDKCKGETWTLVQDETTFTQLGWYVPDEGEDEKINTVVWTRVLRGGGVVTFDNKEK